MAKISLLAVHVEEFGKLSQSRLQNWNAHDKPFGLHLARGDTSQDFLDLGQVPLRQLTKLLTCLW